jgi:creatinine amidohydrolase
MNVVAMTAPEIRAAAPHSVAVLPLAAIEQHGPHLAVSTDTCLVTHVAEQLEQARPQRVILCPTLPFGASHHHLAFGGTLSIGHRLYTDVIMDLVQSLLATGFTRIVLLNGHGGNITPVKQALAALSPQLDRGPQSPMVALAVYWELGGQAFAGAPPMETPALSHACEYETSMMLHLYPERVHLERAARARHTPANGYLPWEDEHAGRGISMTKPTHYISSNGSSGEPARATAAKGAHLLAAAVAAAIAFVDAFATWPTMEDMR